MPIEFLLSGQRNTNILVSIWTNMLSINKSGDLKDALVLSREEVRD